MTQHLYACQDATGREIVAAYVEVEKVTDVTVDRRGEIVTLQHNGETVKQGVAPKDAELTLHRWLATDKLGTPVSHKVS